jgi:hypothetical protein
MRTLAPTLNAQGPTVGLLPTGDCDLFATFGNKVTGAGFLDYAVPDIDAYREQRSAELVELAPAF